MQEAQRAFRYLHSTFHDPREGGYFTKFDLVHKGPVELKSHESLVSTPLKFLFDIGSILKKAPIQDLQHKQLVTEVADLVAARPVDPLPIQKIQTSWLLMRAARTHGVDAQRKARYLASARSILSELLQSDALDLLKGGVQDAYIENSRMVFWEHKVSWHQAQALLAFTLADKVHLFGQSELSDKLIDFRDKTLDFYFRFIVNKAGVGDRLIVKTYGVPISRVEASHSIGTYYQTELSIHMKDMALRY